MRTAGAVLACALTCAAWPAGARAAEASATELRALAAAAQRDRVSLERLRAIDVVDGRPAQIATGLSGSDADVRARLRTLAQEGAPAAARPDRARSQAREVLAQRRFRGSSVGAPLRSLRERIGASLRRPLEAAFTWVADRLPGGPPVLLALLAAVALAAAAAFAARAGSRRAGAGTARLAGGGAGGEERMSAARLRQQADAAERRGDLDAALRLRFRAGLVELDSRELIELRPALTNRELLRAVPSPTLAGLVDGFEAVAYGGRAAVAHDLRSARESWPQVVDELRAR